MEKFSANPKKKKINVFFYFLTPKIFTNLGFTFENLTLSYLNFSICPKYSKKMSKNVFLCKSKQFMHKNRKKFFLIFCFLQMTEQEF